MQSWTCSPGISTHTVPLTFQDIRLSDLYHFGLYSHPYSTLFHCYWLDSSLLSLLLSSVLHSVFLESSMLSKIKISLYPYPSTKERKLEGHSLFFFLSWNESMTTQWDFLMGAFPKYLSVESHLLYLNKDRENFNIQTLFEG